MVRIHPCPPRMSSVAVCGAFFSAQNAARDAADGAAGGKLGATRRRQDESSAAGGRSGRHCPGAARRALAAQRAREQQTAGREKESRGSAGGACLEALCSSSNVWARHSLTRQEKVSPSALRPAACLPSKRASLIFRMSSSCSLAAEKMTALPPSGVSPSTGVMASWRR